MGSLPERLAALPLENLIPLVPVFGFCLIMLAGNFALYRLFEAEAREAQEARALASHGRRMAPKGGAR
jgi:hypothetical protein